MYIIIKARVPDNIIGLKEEISWRLDDIALIEFIDVREEGENCG